MRREFELICADGARLFARVWEAEAPRAVICIAHGLGEYGDRHAKFAEFMSRNGITVYCHDQRGHGHNVKKKSDRGIARMRDLERDFVTMIGYAKKETGLPVFIFGHSLGGLVGLFTTLNAKPEVAGSIITSPWLQLVGGPPKALFDVVSAMAGMMGKIAIANGLSAEDLSHDQAVNAAYRPDPMNHEKIGLGLAGDAHRTAQWVLDNPDRLSVPLLLCHGAADKICDVNGSREFAQKAEGVRYVEFPHAYHEIHNEPEDAQKLFETELAFIDEILG